MEGTIFMKGPRGQTVDCAETVVVIGHVGGEAASERAVIFEHGKRRVRRCLGDK